MIELVEYHGWKVCWTGWRLNDAYMLEAYWIAEKQGEHYRIFTDGKANGHLQYVNEGVEPEVFNGAWLKPTATDTDKLAYQVRAFEKMIDYLYMKEKEHLEP